MAGKARICEEAVASLVAGLAGFGLWLLGSIPAMLWGTVALRRIRASGGRLRGQGLAVAGLVTGFLSVIGGGLLVGEPVTRVLGNIGRTTTCGPAPEHEASLQLAIEQFYTEYSRLPDPGRHWLETTGPAGGRLLQVLLAAETRATPPQNPRSIVFLCLRETRSGRNGLVYYRDEPVAILDPWGRPLRVALNLAYEDDFTFRYDGDQVVLRGKVCAVWSVGEDGIEGTADDRKSW